ncbi:glycosyltransferase family protein [Confluentibacter lentus]|uniref:hypothetical protein n=1 Tax=Confluentibacter lentus TaxID=1699412 RepID=UPI000C28FBF9|nr:hypothetical protein [Confluentibacter lentus]
MRFLVIVQDLRISGTSAGIGRRSLLGKLRKVYPNSIIEVCYLSRFNTEDRLDLLPVNKITQHIVKTKVPFYTTFLNRIFWRLFHVSLNERYILKQYAKFIGAIDFKKYDHILITSSGIEHETILATHGLPILKNSVLIFHDPYPLSWYVGSNKTPSNLDFFRLKYVMEVVRQSKACASTANCMSHDLQQLYASKKKFYTLPHQFEASVFDFSDISNVMAKSKKVGVSYHGAIMFGREIDSLLDAYQDLINDSSVYKESTEFVLRLRGQDNVRLRNKYSNCENIKILDTLNFSNSCYEQTHEADILIILENGPFYSNVLVGKAPFLASLKKPILCISPERSEMRTLLKDKKYIASYDDFEEIKLKLKNLIDDRLNSNEQVFPFGDYFGDESFKLMLNEILEDKYD